MPKIRLKRPAKSNARVERVIVSETQPERDVLVFNEACELLRVSPSFMRDLIKNSAVPYARLGARKIVFSRKSLLEWLDKQEMMTCYC